MPTTSSGNLTERTPETLEDVMKQGDGVILDTRRQPPPNQPFKIHRNPNSSSTMTPPTPQPNTYQSERHMVPLSESRPESKDPDDFGFSLVDEPEPQHQLSKEVITPIQYHDLESRFNQAVSLFLKLLDGLSASPEKEYIRWPNRVQKIAEIRKQLQQLLTPNLVSETPKNA